MSNDAVFIIDSYGLIYRAYFALLNHPLTNRNGENISAVVIFFRNLKALISKYNPKYLAAAFDSTTKTFRHEMYPEYKATRNKTPDDLHAQVPWIEEILKSLGVPVLRADGFEADDIIAAVAKKCESEGKECRILSGDKDLLQLVTETCKEMQPDKANGGWETLGIEEVTEKWGLPPEKILDYLSLVGDTADNVPGVNGVGDKTAIKLLSQYETLENILQHSDEIKGALGEKIRNGKEDAIFSKKLIALNPEVPIEINFDDFDTKNLDFEKAGDNMLRYGAVAVAKVYGATPKDEMNDLPLFASPAQKSKKNETAEDAEEEKPQVPVEKNKGNYRAVTVPKELEAVIEEILASTEKTVAFDTETDSLATHSAKLVGFSLCSKKGEAVYVPIILPGDMFADPTIEKKTAVQLLSRLFENPDVTVAMHNGKFDMEVLVSNGFTGEFKCKIFDTMVAAWILNPNALGKTPYGLEYLGETRLHLKGIEFSEIVEKGKTFADVPLDKAYEYGAEDSDFTFQLYQLFSAELKENNLEELYYNMEMKILPILAEMEIEGIHLNKKALADYSVELAQTIAQKEKSIYELAGREFKIASPKQLQDILFQERGLPHGKKTKTGYSTDTEVLEELASTTDDPLPQAILDYRGATKLLSTYVESLPKLADEKSMIHTSFMQTGTATGRLSSRDPNLQNIPVRDDAGRKIRAAFTAEPGTVLISADYAQIELVVMAHLSGDKNLCQAFINGTDVHKATASLIYGIPAEEVKPEQRRFAKTVNFGVIYGMSAFRLAKDLGISRTEAKNFIDKYFATYSSVKEFLEKTKEDARKNGYVETITGRRRYVPEITNKNKVIQQAGERIATNSPIQGSAADIVKTAMIKVRQELKKQNLGVKMLLQVHDELIFKCPDNEETIQAAISIIRSQMESAIKLSVPLKVSIEYGKNWGEFH